PPSLVVHGLEATGKSSIVKSCLRSSGLLHAIVNSRESITARHLLERTVASCLKALKAASDPDINVSPYGYCESISALAVHLQRLLQAHGKFVLVFDGIDRQREAPPTLLPALARFGEVIPNLIVIFISTLPLTRHLHKPGVPHIAFPPYSRDQSIHILCRTPPPIFLEPPSPSLSYTQKEADEDAAWVWSRFLAVIWDSLAKGAARDLVSFKDVAEKLWRPFVAPIVDGSYGTRDFSRLMVKNRTLFQSENVLIDSIIPETTGDSANGALNGTYYHYLNGECKGMKLIQTTAVTHDLPYYSQYILCAAYLASYNPPRLDSLHFLKSTTRKRRKKGGGTALSGAGRPAKHRKIPRHLLSPSPFPLDRLLAILHAILPHSFVPTADVYTQIATLASLRLLVRTGTVGADVLDAGVKWKVNFGWDYAMGVARSVGCDIRDYLAE
ncbi:hypothetical protein LTR04_003454, partial [Oleoguttula sp. CCFEE 6159]